MAFYKKLSIAAVLSMVALVRAEPPTNNYLPPSNQGYNYDRPSVPFPAPRPTPFAPAPAPAPAPQPTYGGAIAPSYEQDHGHDHAHEPGMPYDFQYAVKDDYYGTDYSRNEVSDGNTITGEYRVQLPDGRLQIVRYTADWQHGYNADVTYEGEAKYPEPTKTGGGQLGAYGPPQQPSNGGYQYKK